MQHTLTDEQIIQVVQDYKDGKSTREIGKELGVNKNTIGRALKTAGMLMRPPDQKKNTDEQIAKAVKDYEAGKSLREIGGQLGLNPKTAWRCLKVAGAAMRPSEERKIEIDQAVKDYEAGKSSIELGRQFGANPKTVRKRLKAAGVVMREFGSKKLGGNVAMPKERKAFWDSPTNINQAVSGHSRLARHYSPIYAL